MKNNLSAVVVMAGVLVRGPAAAAADWQGGIARNGAEKVGKNVASETAKEVAHQQGITQMDGVIDQAILGQQQAAQAAQLNAQPGQRIPSAAELKLLKNATNSHPMGGVAAALSVAGMAQGR
jgi:hypothetical protein